MARCLAQRQPGAFQPYRPAQVLLGETGEVEELLAVLATRDARVLDVGGR